jgi:hypothetical protein
MRADRAEMVEIIEQGDSSAILRALRDPSIGERLLRRIMSLLYSREPEKKWRGVSALGVVFGAGGLGGDKLERQVQRLLWAMNDESGAVPYGIPEALGELVAVRPELRARILPILVSYVVEEELFQTGPILAGAIWALGRVGIEEPEERARALPGLEAALGDDGSDVRGAALWTLARLGVAGHVAEGIRARLQDQGRVCLLIDGRIEEIGVSELARRALDDLAPSESS